MKPVIIIVIAVICSVVAVFSIQFLIFSDNEIISSLTVDCAKRWDKFSDFYYKVRGETIYTPDRTMEIIDELEEMGKDFLKNRCASTVNDWAYRTQDENSLWEIDWQMMAEMEEKWLKENP